MSSQRIAIQNLMYDLSKQGPFYEVSYDPSTRKPVQIDITTATAVEPTSIQVNEIDSKFTVDKLHGRSEILRTDWKFELLLAFKKEVLLEFFEKKLMLTPPRIAPDAQKGWKQVTIFIDKARPSHPVQQQSPTGTKVTLAFTARLGRV